MSGLRLYMRGNKTKDENVKYAVTKTLLDENGDALEWELRHLKTEDIESLRLECTKDVPIKGKKGQYTTKFDSAEYVLKLMVRSVVVPDLCNKELQDSYGVMTPEDLIKQLIDVPSEYIKFAEYIQEFNNFDTNIDEEIEEAKK